MTINYNFPFLKAKYIYGEFRIWKRYSRDPANLPSIENWRIETRIIFSIQVGYCSSQKHHTVRNIEIERNCLYYIEASSSIFV